MLDKRRLSSADVAGDDDETLGLIQTVGQVGHGLRVHAALEEKT